MPDIFRIYADLIQNATPHDADMIMLGAVMFAVPQLIGAALWLTLKAILGRD